MKFLTLEEWSKKNYASDYPSIQTLQRWARNGNFYPAAEKHGRSYRVKEDAIYINPRIFTLRNYNGNENQLITKIMKEAVITARKK